MSDYKIVFIILIGLSSCTLSETKKAVDYLKDSRPVHEINADIIDRFDEGKIEEVKNMIDTLKFLIPKYDKVFDMNDAIHKVNLAQGRIAVLEGNMEKGKKFLLKAGEVKGSAVMNSFGPNMSLAKDLLLKGEKETVIEYLNLCKKFWKMEDGRIAKWQEDILQGRIPDFGPNMVY